MKFFAFSASGLALTGQSLLMIFGLAGLYLVPPARGQMLLLPLSAQARTDLAAVAIAHGARLVAAGPISGSLIIAGDRGRLAMPLIRHGIMPVAAAAAGCGTGTGINTGTDA